MFLIGGDSVPYADALNAKIDNVYSAAGSAQADLAGVTAGADVLSSQFADVKLTMQYLQSLMNELKSGYWYTPCGVIVPFGGAYANRPPAGWLFCDGSVVSQTTFADLFSVVGSSYNTSGEGAGNFRLPDLRGRVPLGQTSSVSGGAPALDSGISSRSHGAKYGAESTVLSSAHIPEHSHGKGTLGADGTGYWPHNHGISDPGHVHGYASLQYLGADTASGTGKGRYGSPSGVNTTNSGTGISINNTDLNHGHSISGSTGNYGTADASRSGVPAVQPSLAVSFIIKY